MFFAASANSILSVLRVYIVAFLCVMQASSCFLVVLNILTWQAGGKESLILSAKF